MSVHNSIGRRRGFSEQVGFWTESPRQEGQRFLGRFVDGSLKGGIILRTTEATLDDRAGVFPEPRRVVHIQREVHILTTIQ